MNKTLKKLMMAIALCGAFCGTATAAPKGGAPARGKAPAAMTARTPAPAKHVAKAPSHGYGHVEPARPGCRDEVARHTPPPPKHHETKHRHDHRCDHRCNHHDDHHGDNWCMLGASVIGSIVGGIIGAAL